MCQSEKYINIHTLNVLLLFDYRESSDLKCLTTQYPNNHAVGHFTNYVTNQIYIFQPLSPMSHLFIFLFELFPFLFLSQTKKVNNSEMDSSRVLMRL